MPGSWDFADNILHAGIQHGAICESGKCLPLCTQPSFKLLYKICVACEVLQYYNNIDCSEPNWIIRCQSLHYYRINIIHVCILYLPHIPKVHFYINHCMYDCSSLFYSAYHKVYCFESLQEMVAMTARATVHSTVRTHWWSTVLDTYWLRSFWIRGWQPALWPWKRRDLGKLCNFCRRRASRCLS